MLKNENILTNLTESEIEFLEVLSYRLKTQNQRHTAYPVWRVCDVEVKCGVSDSIADGYCIINVETGEVMRESEEVISKIISVESIKLNEEMASLEDVSSRYSAEVNVYSLKSLFDFIIGVLKWENYTYCGYVEVMKEHASFITEKGAENFLSENSHKYTEDAYIYVDSAYGNIEMMMLMDILKKLKS